MSVVNEFNAKGVRYSQAESVVLIMDEFGSKLTFSYTIHCKYADIYSTHFFFDTKDWRCLIVNLARDTMTTGNIRCVVLKFWLNEEESPTLSAKLYEGFTSKLLFEVDKQFREQYASLVLDGIINQD